MNKFFNKNIYLLVFVTAGLLFSSPGFAEIAIVTSAKTRSGAITAKDAKKIFLGKKRSLPGGASVKPIDQGANSAARKLFYNKVVRKNPSQVKSYWSKMIFSGKGTPPKEVSNDAAVKSWIATNPGTIGYINSRSVDGSVKVLLKVR